MYALDLSDDELGAERPILGATDGPFFVGSQGERFASPMSLVGSLSFPFYLAAMRRPDLARDARFLTPELRQHNLDALHHVVQERIWTFADMETLDAQLDEAKTAPARSAASRSSPPATGLESGTRYGRSQTARVARSRSRDDRGTSQTRSRPTTTTSRPARVSTTLRC